MTRRFPTPWVIEDLVDSFKVVEGSGHGLAYIYFRETAKAAAVARV
jgi:hypothetical protein